MNTILEMSGHDRGQSNAQQRVVLQLYSGIRRRWERNVVNDIAGGEVRCGEERSWGGGEREESGGREEEDTAMESAVSRGGRSVVGGVSVVGFGAALTGSNLLRKLQAD